MKSSSPIPSHLIASWKKHDITSDRDSAIPPPLHHCSLHYVSYKEKRLDSGVTETVKELILIGGGNEKIQDSIYSYRISERKWEKVAYQVELPRQPSSKSRGSIPSSYEICGVADAGSCSDGQYIYLFGGLKHNQEGRVSVTNEVLRYDPYKRTLTTLIPYSSPKHTPEPRSGCSLTFVEADRAEDDYLVVLGGVSFDYYMSDDVKRFYINDAEWTNLTLPDDKLSMRQHHTAVFWPGTKKLYPRIYVFGGLAGEKGYEKITNDFMYYDIDLRKWIEVKASGKCPPPLSSHSMFIPGKSSSRIIIFGGQKLVGSAREGFLVDCEPSDSIYCYDIELDAWIPVISDSIGDLPLPRWSFGYCNFGDIMYIYGGIANTDGRQNKPLEAVNELWSLQVREPSLVIQNFDYMRRPSHGQAVDPFVLELSWEVMRNSGIKSDAHDDFAIEWRYALSLEQTVDRIDRSSSRFLRSDSHSDKLPTENRAFPCRYVTLAWQKMDLKVDDTHSVIIHVRPLLAQLKQTELGPIIEYLLTSRGPSPLKSLNGLLQLFIQFRVRSTRGDAVPSLSRWTEDVSSHIPLRGSREVVEVPRGINPPDDGDNDNERIRTTPMSGFISRSSPVSPRKEVITESGFPVEIEPDLIDYAQPHNVEDIEEEEVEEEIIGGATIAPLGSRLPSDSDLVTESNVSTKRKLPDELQMVDLGSVHGDSDWADKDSSNAKRVKFSQEGSEEIQIPDTEMVPTSPHVSDITTPQEKPTLTRQSSQVLRSPGVNVASPSEDTAKQFHNHKTLHAEITDTSIPLDQQMESHLDQEMLAENEMKSNTDLHSTSKLKIDESKQGLSSVEDSVPLQSESLNFPSSVDVPNIMETDIPSLIGYGSSPFGFSCKFGDHLDVQLKNGTWCPARAISYKVSTTVCSLKVKLDGFKPRGAGSTMTFALINPKDRERIKLHSEDIIASENATFLDPEDAFKVGSDTCYLSKAEVAGMQPQGWSVTGDSPSYVSVDMYLKVFAPGLSTLYDPHLPYCFALKYGDHILYDVIKKRVPFTYPARVLYYELAEAGNIFLHLHLEGCSPSEDLKIDLSKSAERSRLTQCATSEDALSGFPRAGEQPESPEMYVLHRKEGTLPYGLTFEQHGLLCGLEKGHSGSLVVNSAGEPMSVVYLDNQGVKHVLDYKT